MIVRGTYNFTYFPTPHKKGQLAVRIGMKTRILRVVKKQVALRHEKVLFYDTNQYRKQKRLHSSKEYRHKEWAEFDRHVRLEHDITGAWYKVLRAISRD